MRCEKCLARMRKWPSPDLSLEICMNNPKPASQTEVEKAHPSARRTGAWILSPLLPLMLLVVGTSTLAYSWWLQNTDLSDANDNISRLMRSQLVVSQWEAKRDQWLIALNQEIAKEKPHPGVLALSASESLKATAIWQSYMALRVAKTQEDRDRIIHIRESLIKQADTLNAAGDYRSLGELLQKHTGLSNLLGVTKVLDTRFVEDVDEARRLAKAISNRIWQLYLFGTTLILTSTVIASIQTDLTLRRIHTNVAPLLAKGPKRSA